ncbi:MAG TPA: hypothetical protein PLC79_12340 [Phycisphaerae bacterium]|nr:hypothetical protein [Phycisphaerae bacterium]
MIRLLFVVDGERDAVTVPRLVERILTTQVAEETRPWARLHGAPKGYRSKLLFAMRQAQDSHSVGLVAVVDADRDHEGRRLRAMREARDEERTRSAVFPTALGEAFPHGEAWLLDDPSAVREALGLPADTAVPTVRHAKNPKKSLEELHATSRRTGDRPVDVWADIARRLDPSRCAHAAETGFSQFAGEVRCEIGPVVTIAGRNTPGGR